MTTQPKFEKYALVLLLLIVVGFAATFSGRILTSFYPGLKTQMTLQTATFAGIFMVLTYLMRIAVACWLWAQAKHDKRAKWTWASLGLFGGLWAPVLYFIIPIAEAVRLSPNDSPAN